MRPFVLNKFAGTLPSRAPKLLPDTHGQTAENCRVESGRLVPINTPNTLQAVTQGDTPRGMYKLVDTWVSWDQDVDVEPSLVVDLYEEMVEGTVSTIDPANPTTTLVDNKVNFELLGVRAGMTVHNKSNNTYSVITSITQTVSVSDTLVFVPTIPTAGGNTYLVINEQSVDDRFYYTGDHEPRQSNTSLALPLSTLQGPADELYLGLNRPTHTPHLELLTDGNGTVARVTNYVYTYVNVFGEESMPSKASHTVEVEEEQTVVISHLKMDSNTLAGVEYIRLYRAVAGTNVSQYQLVTQVSRGAHTGLGWEYEDTKLDRELSSVLMSSNYNPPPDAMQGLCKFNNSVYAGFYKNSVYLSEPNVPHAWPIEYAIDLPYTVVAIASHDNQLIVMTDEVPFVIFGEDPASVSVTPVPFKQPALSKRAAISTPYGVIYLCPDGLQQIVNSTTYKVITEGMVPRDFWVNTPDLKFEYFDGLLLMMQEGTGHGWYIDLTMMENGLFTIDLTDDFHIWDLVVNGNTLYMLGSDGVGDYFIWEWNKGEESLVITWKTKIVNHRDFANYATAKILAEEDVTVTYSIDGQSQNFGNGATKTVLNGDNFRLPGRKRGRNFELEISTTGYVDYLGLGKSSDFA